MTQMNKVMDPQKTAAMMREFQKESTKMDMTEEMSRFHSNLCILMKFILCHLDDLFLFNMCCFFYVSDPDLGMEKFSANCDLIQAGLVGQ